MPRPFLLPLTSPTEARDPPRPRTHAQPQRPPGELQRTAGDAARGRHSLREAGPHQPQRPAPEAVTAPRRGPGDNAQPPTRSTASRGTTPPQSARRPPAPATPHKPRRKPGERQRRQPCRVYHPTPRSAHRPRRSRHRAPPPRRQTDPRRTGAEAQRRHQYHRQQPTPGGSTTIRNSYNLPSQ